MSLYGALYTGVSGLSANGRALGATATNIANVNTTGYKSTKNEFSTLLATDFLVTPTNGGVKAVPIQQVSLQGTIAQTVSGTDLAISGSGFFTVTDTANADPALTQLLYTRAGSFVKDADGFLRNAAGYYLQGWELDANGDIPANPADVTVVNLGNVTGTADPTTTASLRINLKSTTTANGAYVTGDLNSGTLQPDFETSIEVYDSQGGAQPMRLSFIKTAANTWNYEVIYDGDPANIGGAAFNPISAGQVTFNDDGTLATPATPVTVTIPWDPVSGLTPQNIDINLGTPNEADGLTQYDASSILYSHDVNGALYGGLVGARVDGDGYVIALFDNGVEKKLYKLPVATFQNPDGLIATAGNAYRRSVESGDVSLKSSKEAGAGAVESQALESSNVDLAKEFSDMIVVQRAYSAASKIITTADEMLDELTRLKR